MLKADEQLIRWVLFETDISTNKISKESGVPVMTVSDLRNGTDIKKMRFYNASKLTDYAIKIEEDNKKEK